MYVLGATNDLGLRNKASYFLQWSVIQRAKEKGFDSMTFAVSTLKKIPEGINSRKELEVPI